MLLILLKNWNVEVFVMVLLSGGVNHSACCISDSVPGHCLSLCTVMLKCCDGVVVRWSEPQCVLCIRLRTWTLSVSVYSDVEVFVMMLLSGGVNHSACCISDSVPGHCLSLCTGDVISSPLHVTCLPHIAHIVNCLHQTLGISLRLSTV